MRTDNPTAALDYIRALYAAEDELLLTVRKQMPKAQKGMQIGPEEGRILQLLIHLTGTRTILELGTCVGYSSLWMARALPKYGHLITIERDRERAETAETFFKKSDDIRNKITLYHGKVLDVLPHLATEEKFDMMFIDADKGNYGAYLDWGEKHVKKDGLIVLDNTLLFGSVYQATCPKDISEKSWNVMREVNKRVADTSKYEAVMLPTVEGLTVAKKLF